MTTQADAAGYAESFATVRTLDDILGTVDMLAGSVADAHQLRLGAIASGHEIAFQEEDRQPGTHSIPGVLKKTESDVEEQLDAVRGQVGAAIGQAAGMIPPLLGTLENKLVDQTIRNADAYIYEPAGVEGIVAFGGGMLNKAAMRLVVYRAIMATAAQVDAEREAVVLQSWIRHSSGAIAKGLKAYLDKYVYMIAQEQAQPKVAGGYRSMERTLTQASSGNAGMAMKAALDSGLLESSNARVVFDRVRGTLGTPKLFRAASSPTVERVLMRHFRPLMRTPKDADSTAEAPRYAPRNDTVASEAGAGPIRVASQRLDRS